MPIESLQLNEFVAFAQRTAGQLGSVDFTPVMKRAAVAITADAKTNFVEQHGPDGSPWLPLARQRDRKRDRRAKKGNGNAQQVLRDTGVLMASVTARGDGHIEYITSNSLEVGTNLDYAAVHQYGHTFNRPEKTRQKPWVFTVGGETVFTRRIRAHQQKIPPRPFLGFSAALVEKVEKLFAEFVADKIGGV